MYRIGSIVVAIVLLGVAGWAVFALSGFFDWRARNALLARGSEVLRQNGSNNAIVPLEELFGGDIDGACIVWNGPVDEIAMRVNSPAKFGPAITAITKMHAGDSAQDSDTRYWIIHTVKNGAVRRTYSLSVRTTVDLYRTDAHAGEYSHDPQDRCFESTVPAQISFYSESNGDNRALIIKVPAEPPAAGP